MKRPVTGYLIDPVAESITECTVDRDDLISYYKAIGCDTLVLDDGFQYLALKGRLNLLLIDSTNPFGNGVLLPRGILREPIKHIRGEVREGGEEPSGEAAPEGKPKDVKLGVKLAPLSPEMAREMKLEAGEKGVVVAEVVPDSPAERAVLQRGDLILEVGKEKVSKPDQVVAAVSKMKAGQVVVLRVKRGPGAIYVPVRLEKGDEKK